MLAIYRADLTAHGADVGGRHPLRERRVDPTAWAALSTSVVISHNRRVILGNAGDLRPHPTPRVHWALNSAKIAGKARHG